MENLERVSEINFLAITYNENSSWLGCHKKTSILFN